jgi:hypothetical protein
MARIAQKAYTGARTPYPVISWLRIFLARRSFFQDETYLANLSSQRAINRLERNNPLLVTGRFSQM